MQNNTKPHKIVTVSSKPDKQLNKKTEKMGNYLLFA